MINKRAKIKMLLLELYDKGMPGLSSEGEDNSRPKWGEARKTKLTLRQLRKLRKMLDVRRVEERFHLKKVQAQYNASPAESAGPPVM